MSSATPARIPLTQVDAFTDRAFRGNPAAVCQIEDELPAQLMQSIAQEMNLSETAFVTPPDSEGVRGLRWFTPGLEVDLCGHATLATAHTLYEGGAESPLLFDTRSGRLQVDRLPDGRLQMDFPSMPPSPASPPSELLKALGIGGTPPCGRGPSGQYWMVVLDDEAMVRGLLPDFGRLGEIDLDGRIGVTVTAPGDGVDFVSRFFGPWAGVEEDPVTGSAHCMLGPYWCDRLGRQEMSAKQVGPRPGELTVRMQGDRALLIGEAVTVMNGTLLLPVDAG